VEEAVNRKPSKRWEIEFWTHKPSGHKLVLYYDKDARKFWGRVGTEMIESSTQEETKKLMQVAADSKLVEESRWERVIFVEAHQNRGKTNYSGYVHACSHDSPLVGFTCWRAWRLQAWDGKVLTRMWDRTATDQWSAERIAKGMDVTQLSIYGDDAKMLPYTDELWERLLAFSARLRVLADELDLVMRSDDLVARLMGGDMPLLPGADEPEEEDPTRVCTECHVEYERKEKACPRCGWVPDADPLKGT
jgi:hypothetical protein